MVMTLEADYAVRIVEYLTKHPERRDARTISEKHLGGYFPNTPMLSAIVQVSRVLEPGRFIADMEASFRHKFATKPQVIQGNMNCLIQSMKEVRQA